MMKRKVTDGSCNVVERTHNIKKNRRRKEEQKKKKATKKVRNVCIKTRKCGMVS